MGNGFSSSEIIKEILESIEKKLNKLNKKDFSIHKSNRLFIVVDCFDEDIKEAGNEISEVMKKYDNHFDTIYFLNNNCLWVYNDNKLHEKPIIIEKNYKEIIKNRYK